MRARPFNLAILPLVVVFAAANAMDIWTLSHSSDAPGEIGHYRSISCVKPSTCFAMRAINHPANIYDVPSTHFVKTTDGGISWTPTLPHSAYHGKSVDFVSVDTGWTVGRVYEMTPFQTYSATAAQLYQTTDGGTSWVLKLSTGWRLLHHLDFLDGSLGWTVGDSGAIRKTTNGGGSWVQQPSGTVKTLRMVQFLNADTGWVVGDSGVILKSTNGGVSWSTLTSGTMANLNALHFWNSQLGWVAGASGTLLNTTDGGATWTPQSVATTSNLTSVRFARSNVGFVAVANNLFKTVNGGSKWNFQGVFGKVGIHGPGISHVYFQDTLGFLLAEDVSPQGFGGTGDRKIFRTILDTADTGYTVNLAGPPQVSGSPRVEQGNGSLHLTLPRAERVSLTLLDTRGKRTSLLLESPLTVGLHRIPLPKNQGTGPRIVWLQVGEWTKSLILPP